MKSLNDSLQSVMDCADTCRGPKLADECAESTASLSPREASLCVRQRGQLKAAPLLQCAVTRPT